MLQFRSARWASSRTLMTTNNWPRRGHVNSPSQVQGAKLQARLLGLLAMCTLSAGLEWRKYVTSSPILAGSYCFPIAGKRDNRQLLSAWTSPPLLAQRGCGGDSPILCSNLERRKWPAAKRAKCKLPQADSRRRQLILEPKSLYHDQHHCHTNTNTMGPPVPLFSGFHWGQHFYSTHCSGREQL